MVKSYDSSGFTKPAVEVDAGGLARKLANKPKESIIYELYQNAADENCTLIDIKAEMVPKKQQCHITVLDDDPDGFQDIRSTYTMFKDSKKANDPTKRGVFEIGEKLVVVRSMNCMISTTKGTVYFKSGLRNETSEKRKSGTLVDLHTKMTRAEYDDVVRKVHMLITEKDGPKVIFNGERITPREPIVSFETTLTTVRTDEEGQLKNTQRKTKVEVYKVRNGEEAHIYEMGVPIMPTGDTYHYNVMQKVPVNWERVSVPRSFLKKLRVQVLNHVSDKLDTEDATQAWVQDSLDQASSEAVDDVLTQQYGDKRVIYDPSDPEGSKIAMSEGYTVIPGRSHSKEAWENIKASGAVLPAGQVTPSSKAYSDDPNAPVERLLPEEKWTPGIKRIVNLTKRLAKELIGHDIHVRISLDLGMAAAYGSGQFVYSYKKLGKKFFERQNKDREVLRLILHEFGHEYCDDHLNHKFHNAIEYLGADFGLLLLNKPKVLDE